MSKGIFIVIEGIDGTGKSTQAKRLGKWFQSQGREVIISYEPTHGTYGEKLRHSMTGGRLMPAEELELFIKDRQEHVHTLIQPAIEAGKVVILDRYYFSTMAYQGARGFDPQSIREMNESFAPIPDLLLILDLDVDTAHQRIGCRGDSTNEFEQRDTLARCREVFLSLKDENFACLIDASADMDVVTQRILSAVQASPLS
jgi:dTMP kinase